MSAPEVRTVGQAINFYLDRRRYELREESRRKIRDDLDSVAGHVGYGLALDGLTADVLDGWFASQAVARSTLQKRVSSVKVWCRWLAARDILPADPSIRLPRVKRERTVPRALSAAQVEALWQHNMPARTRLCISLMLFEGLRRGEISRLCWEHIRHSDGEYVMLVSGKGGHERVLPVSPMTTKLLDLHPERMRQGPVVRSESTADAGVNPATVSKLVREVMRQAGLDGSPHCLRHTAATDALRSGCDIRTVQRFLGHASVVTTEAYLPWDVDNLAQAVEGRTYSFSKGRAAHPGTVIEEARDDEPDILERTRTRLRRTYQKT